MRKMKIAFCPHFLIRLLPISNGKIFNFRLFNVSRVSLSSVPVPDCRRKYLGYVCKFSRLLVV